MAKGFPYRSVMRLLLGAIAGLLFVETFEFRQLEKATFGPATWPRAVLIILLICIVIDVVKSSISKEEAGSGDVSAYLDNFIYLHRDRCSQSISKEEAGSGDVSAYLNWNLVVGFTTCLGGYVVGMMIMGFPLATFAFCWIVLLFHRIRNWKVCLSVAVGVTVVSVLLFLRVLYLSLPRGMWIFYDTNNFFLSFIGR